MKKNSFHALPHLSFLFIASVFLFVTYPFQFKIFFFLLVLTHLTVLIRLFLFRTFNSFLPEEPHYVLPFFVFAMVTILGMIQLFLSNQFLDIPTRSYMSPSITSMVQHSVAIYFTATCCLPPYLQIVNPSILKK